MIGGDDGGSAGDGNERVDVETEGLATNSSSSGGTYVNSHKVPATALSAAVSAAPASAVSATTGTG